MSFLFFFQAEDGIRDPLVTGVQTCALPISSGAGVSRLRGLWRGGSDYPMEFPIADAGVENCAGSGHREYVGFRSEERRVGKECRCRWSAYRKKKKEQLD